MTMTTQQQERLLGQLCRGVSTEAACAALGIAFAELTAALDSDPSLRLSVYLAQIVRDKFLEQMEALQE